MTILFQYHQLLFPPVLQHLPDGVVAHFGAFYRYRVLHRLLKRKLDVQSLKDRVVLAAFLSFAILPARIVATQESVLYAVTEEVERILQQLVGYHVVSLQHRGCLRLQQELAP